MRVRIQREVRQSHSGLDVRSDLETCYLYVPQMILLAAVASSQTSEFITFSVSLHLPPTCRAALGCPRLSLYLLNDVLNALGGFNNSNSFSHSSWAERPQSQCHPFHLHLPLHPNYLITA